MINPRIPKSTDGCVICGHPILGFGNNALPVKAGQCCGVCNDMVVIPKRLDNAFKLGYVDSPEVILNNKEKTDEII